jgi:O-methyltransferase
VGEESRMNAPLDEPATLYLDLLKKCLTRIAFPDRFVPVLTQPMPPSGLPRLLHPFLRRLSCGLYRRIPFYQSLREQGYDWPPEAETMIGLKRLDQLHRAVETILREQIPGDFLEAGVWRGGAAIFLRAALQAYGDRSRTVWLADSFAGLPRPDARYPADAPFSHWRWNSILAISLEEVRGNFARYGLLDERVRFLPGWFKDTLPGAPIERIALLRLDGDLYASTMDALMSLYARVSPGGFVVIDDYGALPECRRAVEDYRQREGINAPLEAIDWAGVYWRKAS